MDAQTKAMYLDLARAKDPHIRPWEAMTETDKRVHLAYSHGYIGEDGGGFSGDEWVLNGEGKESDLDDMHVGDHAEYPHGSGGPRGHVHPPQV